MQNLLYLYIQISAVFIQISAVFIVQTSTNKKSVIPINTVHSTCSISILCV